MTTASKKPIDNEAATKKQSVVSIDEYRKQLKDYETPDEIVQKRLEYLEALCRNLIRQELEAYEKTP